MAPIEPDLYNSNLRPLSHFAGYLILASSLIGLISYDVLLHGFPGSPSISRYAPSTKVEPREAHPIVCSLDFNKPGDNLVPYVSILWLCPTTCGLYEMGEPLHHTLWWVEWLCRVRDIGAAFRQMTQGHVVISWRMGNCDRTKQEILVEPTFLSWKRGMVCICWH